MKLAPIFACLLLAAPLSAEDGWVPLFNGKDLDGWTPKFAGHELGKNLRDTFTVQDGMLTVDYSNWKKFKGEFGHLFHDGEYSHYKLRLEYRFIGKQINGGPGWAHRNNGVMIHGQSAESMDKDQPFPDSIEVQLLGGLGEGPRSTANLIMVGCPTVMIDGEPNKARITESKSATFDGDQWVEVMLEVHGSKLIRCHVNGEPVIEARDAKCKDGKPLDSGTISIQAETHPIQFRRIDILELDD